eukprot:7824516-Alexandrium_andersonii.AAC.1
MRPLTQIARHVFSQHPMSSAIKREAAAMEVDCGKGVLPAERADSISGSEKVNAEPTKSAKGKAKAAEKGQAAAKGKAKAAGPQASANECLTPLQAELPLRELQLLQADSGALGQFRVVLAFVSHCSLGYRTKPGIAPGNCPTLIEHARSCLKQSTICQSGIVGLKVPEAGKAKATAKAPPKSATPAPLTMESPAKTAATLSAWVPVKRPPTTPESETPPSKAQCTADISSNSGSSQAT